MLQISFGPLWKPYSKICYTISSSNLVTTMSTMGSKTLNSIIDVLVSDFGNILDSLPPKFNVMVLQTGFLSLRHIDMRYTQDLPIIEKEIFDFSLKTNVLPAA